LEGGRYEDKINLPQPHGTPESKKKVLADFSVKRPDSFKIELGIYDSDLT